MVIIVIVHIFYRNLRRHASAKQQSYNFILVYSYTYIMYMYVRPFHCTVAYVHLAAK